MIVLAVAVGLVLLVGSLAEVHAQSAGYRHATNAGYGALATPLVYASNQTGSQLAALMAAAPGLANGPLPQTARAQLEQGLDEAVDSTGQQAAQAAHLAPPYPSDNVSGQFTSVFNDRYTATTDLRTTIDRLLGMTPLAVAGAPTPAVAASSAPLISVDQATKAMTAAGLVFEHADDTYRSLTTQIKRDRLPIFLPGSAWVPGPAGSAPLSSAALGASAGALAAAKNLVPFHRLVITAVGLAPPAVASGGPGLIGRDCATAVSTVPGAAATVLPPTTTVTAEVTVTNCGTVPETGVVISQTLVLSDPAGAKLPPAGTRGSASHAELSLGAGSSKAVDLRPLRVAGGHFYTLTVTVAVEPNQLDRAGTTQQFLLQVSS
ncbi:MAG TPA: hypothetical protein VHW93_01020 [Acidimicrobiales bacterium]|nr:hypothetical protein [Acidimicrobiales bacterium]